MVAVTMATKASGGDWAVMLLVIIHLLLLFLFFYSIFTEVVQQQKNMDKQLYTSAEAIACSFSHFRFIPLLCFYLPFLSLSTKMEAQNSNWYFTSIVSNHREINSKED